MFDTEPPDATAFRELQTLVGHLADELAQFRRRAITAEGRLKELETSGDGTVPASAAERLKARLEEMERENAELRGRLDAAAERVRQMHDRVRFLRQQAQQAQQAQQPQQGAVAAPGATER